MTEGAEEFLSNISQEKLWNYLDLKCCLIKGSEDSVWKVGFIEIELREEPKRYQKTFVSTFKNLILIHKILRFYGLNRLLQQIIHGERIKMDAYNASLEWISNRPSYDFKTRAYMRQEYNIDYACHLFIRSGEYPRERDVIRNVEKTLSESNTSYRSLEDVVTTLLDVPFGVPAISPFVRVFAPVYVRVEESTATVKNLKILTSASLNAHLSKIRLEMFGENENARPTKLRENITSFMRDEDEILGLLKPIEITVDEESRYVKIKLHYGDELLEDYYIRIPKLVSREIVETVGAPEEQVISEDERILRKKQEIKSKYSSAKSESDNNVKGKLLEQTVSEIIGLAPGLKVADVNIVNNIQEIDILVRNYNKGKENVWSGFDSVFFVECKNWSKKAGVTEISRFKVKLDNKDIKSGIFVAPKGITGRRTSYAARGQINEFLTHGTKIIVLDDADLCEILNCKDVTEKIDDKFIELYKF